MKKISVIGVNAALALSAWTASGVAHAQSSVTLYGLIDVGVDYISNQRSSTGNGGRSFGVQSGNLNTSRWGLRGTEDLGGGLSAIFLLENGFTVTNGRFANSGDEFGRQAYVGLRSQRYGQLTLGRQYDVVQSFVAPLSATSFGGNLAAHPFDADNFANSMRMNNAVMYYSPTYRGFQGGAGFAFSNSAAGFRENSAMTIGARYDMNTLSAAAAFFQSDRPGGVSSGNTAAGALSSSDVDAQLVGLRQRIYAAGLRYGMGNGAVGFVFSRTSLDGPQEVAQGGAYAALPGNYITFYNYELNGKYSLTPAIHVGAAYTYTQGHLVNTGSVEPKYHTMMVQLDYDLSRRTDVYLEGTYRHVSNTSSTVLSSASIYSFGPSANNKQAIVAVGLRTHF